MSEPNFQQFAAANSLAFRRLELLRQAFTHRSYLNENPKLNLEHNERLEFLGDAVLELVVTEHLFAEYPEQTEGDLTAYRAALVNAETLAAVGGGLRMNDYLLLSRGEARDTGRARQIILANTFESIVGAIFLDQGYETARRFLAAHLLPRLPAIVAGELWQDAKSRFQEWSQEHRDLTPGYKVLREEGPDHDKTFTVGLYLGEKLIAEGTGPSKQRAEQEAAKRALLQLCGSKS